MKATPVWILLGLAGCAAPPAPVSPAEAKRTSLAALDDAQRGRLDAVRESFVRLDGDKGSGSALAVSPDGLILTAWHVVEGTFFTSTKDGTTTTRSFFGGRYRDLAFRQPILVAACPEQDVAVLDIGLPTPRFVSPSSRGFAAGERVFLLGGATGAPELAECSRMRATSDARRIFFLMNAPAFPGDSGGGVLNASGELLGILVRANAGAVPEWRWTSVMVPLPSQALEEILRARPLGKRTRLYLESEPADGKIDPIQFWKSIRFRVD